MLAFRTRFWVNVVGRILPLGVSLSFALFSTNNTAKGIAFSIAALMLILVEYLGVYRPLQHLEDVIRKQFDFFFEPFVQDAIFNGVKAEIRVNVMLIGRYFFFRHFFQFYQQGMEPYPDANLHFSIKRGLCGEAFPKNTNEVTFRDLRNDPPEFSMKEYGWSKKEFAAVRHVRAIALIPLYRKRKTHRGPIKHTYYGTLNVDAVNDAGAFFLADPDVQLQIKGFSRFVQISLD